MGFMNHDMSGGISTVVAIGVLKNVVIPTIYEIYYHVRGNGHMVIGFLFRHIENVASASENAFERNSSSVRNQYQSTADVSTRTYNKNRHPCEE